MAKRAGGSAAWGLSPLFIPLLLWVEPARDTCGLLNDLVITLL